jgi:hypothetical protein
LSIVGFRLITPFNDPASVGGASLTIQLGDEDDDGFVTATLHLGEVFIAANTGAYFTVGGDAGTAKGKTYTAVKTLEALFTPTASLTRKPKVKIFAQIVDTNFLSTPNK